MGDWQIHMDDSDLEGFLQQHGLGSVAAAVIAASGADTVDDLRLLDPKGMDEVCADAGLKPVHVAKLRRALAPAAQAVPGVTAAGYAPGAAAPAAAEPGPVAPPAAPAAAPVEAVAVCIDRSGSMGAEFIEVGSVDARVKTRTRMEAVKQMFYAFRDRTEALDETHALGLLQFDNRVDVLCPCTTELDRFEEMVDEMKPRSTTAIYSAIIEACAVLPECAAKRVLCLTDGQSNAGEPVEAALVAAQDVDAVVDAILVGDQCDHSLRRLVAATGGRCFQIQSIGEGFELLESEAAVSVAARGARAATWQLAGAAEYVTGARQLVAPKPEAPKVADLTRAIAAPSAPSGEPRKPMHLRISKELRQVQTKDAGVWMRNGDGVHIFPSDDLTFWRVLLEGPADSPFAGGVFVLRVRIPDNYPFSEPNVTFETPIYHCNVSETGFMCLFQGALFEPLNRWEPSLTVPKILEAVRDLMKKPDTNNALRSWLAELTRAEGMQLLPGELSSKGTDTRYSDEARKQTAQHASMTVDEWRQAWGC